MNGETRIYHHDRATGLTAFRFQNLLQPFPSHFHRHYVFGLLEAGRRQLAWRNRTLLLSPGDLFVLRPGEPHACAPWNGEPLDYRGLQVPPALLEPLLSPGRSVPQPALQHPEAAEQLWALHRAVMSGAGQSELKSRLALLANSLFRQETLSSPADSRQAEMLCQYLEDHCAEHITLEQLCRMAGLSQSTLLRIFAQAKGTTPYRYLESLRINRATVLLEDGAAPAEAALASGFSDQSHFSRYFRRFTGIPPGGYRSAFQTGTSSEPHNAHTGEERHIQRG